MKAGWKKTTLGEVCVVERGSSPRPIESYLTDSSDGVNWIKIGDTKNVDKYIRSTKQKITREGAEKSRRVEPGDFILSNSMSFGKPYVMAISGYVHDGWFILRLLESIDIDFFHYLLSSDFVQLQFISLAAGSVVKNISKDLVKRAVLPIPPLSEQKRIVSIVDEAFEAIDIAINNTKQNLTNARELFDSYLNAIFTEKGDGWMEKKLGNTCIVERGSSPRPIQKFFTNSSDGVNWIKIGDTKGVNKYIYSTNQKITQEGAKQSRRVEVGDFILTNSMSYGKPYIMGTTGYIHDGWFVLRLADDINKDFFYYLLASNLVQDQFKLLAAGAIVKNISGDLVKKAVLPIPPISQQQTIVEVIEKLAIETQRLEAIYRQKLITLNELKQSILHKAFTGELTADKADLKTNIEPEAIAV
jgi:type I restriction enzyme, S subunit